MKIALAQINPTIADIGGNVAKIKNFASRARELGADIAVFPELCVTGYPPMDLLENQKFISDNISALDEIKNAGLGIAVIVGFISAHDGRLYNSAALIDSSQIKFICHKTLLPTYDVFDEDRYFESAAVRVPVDFCGSKIGITICEDIWNASPELAEEFEMRRYSVDPVAELVAAGSDIIVNLSASPFVKGKNSFKRRMIASVAMKHSVPVVYVNQVGGNDSLVFDGYSFAAGGDGGIAALCAGFEEDIVVYDTLSKDEITIAENEIGDIEKALVLGLRDYVYKSGFKSVLVGLSGGIDSALTAALAVKALGSGNVTGVTMPSRYSSAGSVDDSQTLADNLKIKFHNIPIKSLHDLFLSELSPVFAGMKPDVTEENLQARIRGNILMALSNKFGSIFLQQAINPSLQWVTAPSTEI